MKYSIQSETLTNIADAIRAKNGETELYTPAQMAQKIIDLPSGSPVSAKPKDVNFFDYEGTLLYSYTLDEVQSLTDLPPAPKHSGLVFQEWNWSLSDIKAFTRPMNIGATYITDDGATRLHIRIAAVGRMTVPLYIGQTVANGVTIDWGDGSASETLAGTGYVNTSHTYAEPGDYVISLTPQDGCTLSLGADSSSYCVMGSTGNNGRVYCNMLQEVYVGKNVTTIGRYAFYFCYSLASVTIPDGVTTININAFYSCYSLANVTIPYGVTSIGNDVFHNCYSLANVTIPDGVTSIGAYAFYNCYSLANVTIPDGVTSIGAYAFYNCYSLANVTMPDGVNSIVGSAFYNCYSLANVTIPDGVTFIHTNAFYNCYSLANVTIPDGVTSIGASAFIKCYGMRYYDFSACTSVPALSDTNAFNNIPSDCQMLIPTALYDEWSTATNWTTYASYMVAV